jgi:hypothetical protein
VEWLVVRVVIPDPIRDPIRHIECRRLASAFKEPEEPSGASFVDDSSSFELIGWSPEPSRVSFTFIWIVLRAYRLEKATSDEPSLLSLQLSIAQTAGRCYSRVTVLTFALSSDKVSSHDIILRCPLTGVIFTCIFWTFWVWSSTPE